jgi:hypothetical protein
MQCLGGLAGQNFDRCHAADLIGCAMGQKNRIRNTNQHVMVNEVSRTGRTGEQTSPTAQRPGAVKITAGLKPVYIKLRAQFGTDCVNEAGLGEFSDHNRSIASKCLYDGSDIGRSLNID